MFITSKYSGYNRHGEQVAAGYFLILTQPKYDSLKYPAYAEECACGKTREQHASEALTAVPDCSKHGIVARIRELDSLVKGSPEYNSARDEMEELWATQNHHHDRHIAGCPECEAYKSYYSECRTFRLSHNSYPIRAIVRYVRMGQFGNFMMGRARVLGKSITLSGSYGSDGLPASVDDDIYELGAELPQELRDKWNTGGGWNGAGSEAPLMRKWALDTFPQPKH